VVSSRRNEEEEEDETTRSKHILEARGLKDLQVLEALDRLKNVSL
jgi:hypothetical protein